MDIFEIIDGRVSARKLVEPGPNEEQLQRILEAGVRVPDHGRLAPWRFVVIAGDARNRLGTALADIRRRKEPDCPPEALAAEHGKALRAPMIIVVVAKVTPEHKVPGGEQVMAVAACVQNMVLAANALGFSANWKTGPAAYDAGVKDMLGIGDADQIVAFLYVGTRDSDDKPRTAMLEGLVRQL